MELELELELEGAEGFHFLWLFLISAAGAGDGIKKILSPVIAWNLYEFFYSDDTCKSGYCYMPK